MSRLGLNIPAACSTNILPIERGSHACLGRSAQGRTARNPQAVRETPRNSPVGRSRPRQDAGAGRAPRTTPTMGHQEQPVVLQVRQHMERLGRRRQHQRTALGRLYPLCERAAIVDAGTDTRPAVGTVSPIGGDYRGGELRHRLVLHHRSEPSLTDLDRTARHYRYSVGVA